MRVVVDTNVLVYAHDADAGVKHELAKSRVSELWAAGTGVISTQVLQELYVTITRKIAVPVDRSTARELLRTYSAWLAAPTDVDLVVRASELEEVYRLSFWDALIITAASHARATALLSEDLNDGQIIEGVRIENPFKGA